MWWNIEKLADASVFTTPWALRQGMTGTESLQNTIMASNMILDTSYSTEKVNKMDFEWFKLQIVAGMDNFLYLLMLRLREF